jgi:hypothetical protein
MSTPTRKRSLSGPSGSVKKKKYNCKFQADWMKDFYDQVHSAIRVKISECGITYTPARERTGKREISGISSFVRENPNGRFGRYDYIVKLELNNR